jgi:DNA-directed RNA polymerase I subunit RPA2
MNEDKGLEHYLNRATCSKLDLATQLQYAASHHIESFNYLYNGGLAQVCKHLIPLELYKNETNLAALPFNSLKIYIEDLKIGLPSKSPQQNQSDTRLLPQECRIAGKTYGAPLIATVVKQINNEKETFQMNLSDIPIMVRSDHCHLYQKNAQQLVDLHEDGLEFGGYFILNGLEKIIRLLVLTKRNYPVAFLRNTYLNRGPGFTGYACQMKCVREDETS